MFLATHDYVILKEFDLRLKPDDKIAFHSLYRDPDTGEIDCITADNYLNIHPNAIADAFNSLYDRDVERALTGINTAP